MVGGERHRDMSLRLTTTHIKFWNGVYIFFNQLVWPFHLMPKLIILEISDFWLSGFPYLVWQEFSFKALLKLFCFRIITTLSKYTKFQKDWFQTVPVWRDRKDRRRGTRRERENIRVFGFTLWPLIRELPWYGRSYYTVRRLRICIYPVRGN